MIDKFTFYDEENLPNFFCVGFKDYETGKKKMFVIHKTRNDLRELHNFVRALIRQEYWLVGYNNLNYDSQVLEYILKYYGKLKKLDPEIICTKLNDLSKKIFSLTTPEERFQNLIPPWKLSIPQIDIFKQRHYDSKGRYTSLKWLQFTMRFHDIETMPVPHNQPITDEQVPLVIKYCDHDVDATAEFFKRIKFETDLRWRLSEEFDLDLMNASEPRLARDVFGKFLSNEMGISYRDLTQLRTSRKWVAIKPLIFPYVTFKDPILKEAKTFFEKVEFNPYSKKFCENNMNMKVIKKTFKYHNLNEVSVGLGGIHGCVAPGIYTSTPEWNIEDIDGKSYYPNIAIKNKVYPQHLSPTFCVVYESLYDQRATIPKDDPVNYTYKIILNAAYGQSQEPNTYFHDPNYTFTVTVNGQLLLLKLAELIISRVPDMVIYQFNTDGITIGYHPKYKEEVEKAKHLWSKVTKIILENKFYKKMIIRDVSNYIAIDEKDKIKRKGETFGWEINAENEMDYHKNPGGLIVAKALEQYFVYGKDYKKYIMECNDIFEFCYGVKLKKDFTVERHWYDWKENCLKKEFINQTVIRYFVSNESSKLKKKYKPGTKKSGQTVEFEAGKNTTYYNVHQEKKMKDYNINYKHYLKKVREVIDEIEPNSQNLKLF